MKYFNEKEIEILKNNPYTFSVKPDKIRFTLEFKQFVMMRKKAGASSTQIFKDAGYDVDMIGRERCYSTVNTIHRESRSEGGLKPPVGAKKKEQFEKKQLEKETTKKAIKELQEEVIELRQMVDVLKKTMWLDSLSEEERQKYIQDQLKEDI